MTTDPILAVLVAGVIGGLLAGAAAARWYYRGQLDRLHATGLEQVEHARHDPLCANCERALLAGERAAVVHTTAINATLKWSPRALWCAKCVRRRQQRERRLDKLGAEAVAAMRAAKSKRKRAGRAA